MQTVPLSEAMGVEMSGIDPSAPLSADAVTELRELYDLHHMVLVRGHQMNRKQ
jgi:alpha-ketoglutarate-dependent taurine dioxygenase